jgi:probable rRNA maturation factor
MKGSSLDLNIKKYNIRLMFKSRLDPIDLQIATKSKNVPSRYLFNKWVNAAFNTQAKACGYNFHYIVTVRIVDPKEIQALNKQFRHKNKPTNVLSFPFNNEIEATEMYLGDVVICAPVVEQEAAKYGRTLKFHYAHMCVHGILHLLGYDHDNEKDRLQMEELEAEILQKLKFPQPYD